MRDSITACFKQKPKLSLRWDTHGSFITNTPASMMAFGAGLKFGNCVKLGVSVDFLNSAIWRDKTVRYGNNNEFIDTVKVKLNYAQIGLYSNFVVHRYKKWEFTVPVELGFGSSNYTYLDKANTQKTIAQGFIMNLETMGMAEYKIWPWLGVGGGLGVRLVPVSNKYMNENFNSLLWDANVSIYFGEIYRGIKRSVIKGKEKKLQRI